MTFSLDDLHAAFERHLFLPDLAVVDFTAAVVVANQLTGDALWALIVGASGAGKTEAVLSVGDVPGVHALSTLTKNTLMSGKVRPTAVPTSAEDVVDALEDARNDPSLLIRMTADGESLLAFKDFTTILEMQRDSRAEVMSQLREVYDGSVVKEFGNGKTMTWRGRIGFLAGVTPIIDTHHSILSVLGERFIYLRLAPSERVTIATRAADADNEQAMHAELKDAMRIFVAVALRRVKANGGAPDMPEYVRDRIVAIANMATWARSGVPRDPFSREVLMRPSLEVPTRFTKQLVTLWAALAAMSHPDPVAMCTRVARDSMPRDRWDVLTFLAVHNLGTTTELRHHLRLPPTTTKRLLEDLVALDIIEVTVPGHASTDGDTPVANTYAMTSDARVVWERAIGDIEDVKRDWFRDVPLEMEEGEEVRAPDAGGYVPGPVPGTPDDLA